MILCIKKARSVECKRRIEVEFMKHIRAVSEESPFPFEDVLYHSQCPKVSHPPLVRPILCVIVDIDCSSSHFTESSDKECYLSSVQ